MIISVNQAAETLKNGGIVAIPTETVYGLAVNALEAKSVARVFEAKKRPLFDPLIVHVPDFWALEPLVDEIPFTAQVLAQSFWPGPLTLVMRRKEIIPDLVTAGLSTVAVRIPAHPVARQILRACRFPLAAPSANLFGRVSPTCAADVIEQLEGRIDGVVDGGACAIGVESTIVDVSGPIVRILRPGGISREDIEALIGPVQLGVSPHSHEHGAMIAPGTCERHYSPLTPIRVFNPAGNLDGERAGLIAFGPQSRSREGYTEVVNLSESGDLCEAASHLYAALHRMDHLSLDYMSVEPIPHNGLGLAINDRLRRASAKRV